MSVAGESLKSIAEDFEPKTNLANVLKLLNSVTNSKRERIMKFGSELANPAAQPSVWVTKWMDYGSSKGFGYLLSDNSVGVIFTDNSKGILTPNGNNIHYIDVNGEQSYVTSTAFTEGYAEKMEVLTWFASEMREDSTDNVDGPGDGEGSVTYVYQRWLTTATLLMQLDNCAVQINFKDSIKIIICPLMEAITYIDEQKSLTTFLLAWIEANGCSQKLYERICYACDKITSLLQEEDNNSEKKPDNKDLL